VPLINEETNMGNDLLNEECCKMSTDQLIIVKNQLNLWLLLTNQSQKSYLIF